MANASTHTQQSRRSAPRKFADGGLVRGPGTGTSDEVPDEVPNGTYIMPADSTAAVGEQQLAAMGSRGFSPGRDKVPVQLSNGEYKLPPEQVHAIGVQVLDQMKNATHTPSSSRGFMPAVPRAQQEAEPRQFFSEGGVAGDELRGQRVAPYVNHRAPNGPPVMPEPPLLGNSAPPQTGLQATSRPNFTMGGGPEIPVRPSGPDVTDVRPKFDPANASKEAQAWMAERARTAGAGQPPPAGPAAPVSPAATVAPATAPAPQGAAYRAGAAVGRAAGTMGRAVGAVAVPATLAGTASTVAETPTEDYEKRFGFQPNTQEGFAGFARDVGVRALGAASDLGDGLTLGMAGKYLFADKQGRTDESAIPAMGSTRHASAPTNSPAASQPATTVATPSQPGSHEYGPPNLSALNQPLPSEVIPGVFRSGSSYGDSAQAAISGAAPRGLPSAQNMAAADALAERSQAESLARVTAARGFTPGFTGVIGQAPGNGNMWKRTPEQQQRDAEVSASSIRIPEQARAFMAVRQIASDERARISRANNETALAQTQMQGDTQRDVAAMREQGDMGRAVMRERGDTGRAVLREQGDTSRANARNEIDAGRLALEQQVKGFDIRSGQRQESLVRRYEAAKTPEEKAAIAQQIRDLSGKTSNPRDDMLVVGGGQEWDSKANVMRNVPQRVFDARTRQFVDAGGAATDGPAGMPKIGEARNGYRYKGGNPNDQASWEKV